MAVIEVGRDAPPNSPVLPTLLTRQALAPLPHSASCSEHFHAQAHGHRPGAYKSTSLDPGSICREDAGKSVQRENVSRFPWISRHRFLLA